MAKIEERATYETPPELISDLNEAVCRIFDAHQVPVAFGPSVLRGIADLVQAWVVKDMRKHGISQKAIDAAQDICYVVGNRGIDADAD